MKETIKVSIGGYAFTLDVDAHDVLKGYLDNLKSHFSGKSDGDEIIQDIEARMSELLQLKNVKGENVISLNDAKDIINIMGNPCDFGEDETGGTTNSTPVDKEVPGIAKKFYRDQDNSILGGVCSGIANYFRYDPVIIRVAYIAAVILLNPISHKLSASLVVFYVLLWIIMPVAKTFTQKLAMSGEDPSIEGITSGTARPKIKGEKAGRTLLKVMQILIGILSCFIGMSILLGGIIAVVGPIGFGLPSLNELSDVAGFKSLNFGFSLILLLVVPAFMFLYFGIRIMINFTLKDLLVLGVALIIGIGTSVYTTASTIKYARYFERKSSANQIVPVTTPSDTLYVKLDPKYLSAEEIGHNSELFIERGDLNSYFLMPKVRVLKDSIYADFAIDIKKTAFDRSYGYAKRKAENAKFDYATQDSLVTISPRKYDRNNPWDREYFEVTIYCPISKEVQLDNSISSIWRYVD